MSEDVKLPADAEDAPEVLSIFDIAETDTVAEEDGKWFNDIFENSTGVDVKLRRFTSKAAVKARQRLEIPYRRKLKKGDLPEDVNTQLMMDLLAEGLIVDWRGVIDRDKSEIKFTPSAAKFIFKKVPEMARILSVLASKLDSFRAERREDIAGN